MGEFIPGIDIKTTNKWSNVTNKGYEIIHLEGPDTEGNYAGIVKDGGGRVAGHSFDQHGNCIEGSTDFNLAPAKPKHTITYAIVRMGPLGVPIISAAHDSRFKNANVAFIFDNHTKQLVGSKVL